MSTGLTQPFRIGATVTVAASTAPATAALTAVGDSALLYNSAASVALVSFGIAAADALLAPAIPVPPGGTRLVDVNPACRSVAAVLASGSGSIYVTTGSGTAY